MSFTQPNEDGTLPIDRVHPKLRPLVQQFLLKCKYPYKMYGAGRWLIENENGEPVQFSQSVIFHDPNAQTMSAAGTIKWQHGDFGKPSKYRVVTRKVLNPKYRDAERRKSIETLDEQRALKEMLTHIKPFTLTEIAAGNNNYADGNLARWRSEAHTQSSQYFNIGHNTIVEEVMHLIAKGTEFSTIEFQQIAQQGIAAYHESQKRMQTKIAKHFVKFENNGSISVLSPNGQSSFTAFEMLPSFIQEAVGMLKLMDTQGNHDASILGVGAQAAENMFWVFEPLERTGS